MGDLLVLLKLEFKNFLDFNRFRYTKDKKVKNRYRLLLVAWIWLLIMMVTYVGGLVYGLCSLGLGEVVPAYLTAVSGALILLFGLFSTGNKLFAAKGYDQLASLPIKTGAIPVSRFLGSYFGDLLLTLGVMLPGLAVYGVCEQPPVWFYVAALVGILCIPAIPLVVAALFGTLLLALTARMKHKSLMQTLLSLAVMAGAFSLSAGLGKLEEMTPEQLTDLAQVVSGAIGRVYPPALWLNAALRQGNGWYLLLFAAVSVAVAALALLLVARCFTPLVRRLQTVTARHTYTLGEMHSRGLTKALYLREAKRYFSSGVYVTNTIVGPIMGLVMAAALCVAGVGTVVAALPPAVDVRGLIPVVFGLIFCMMPTTAVSVSMECKALWVVKSLPVPMKALLDSKILLNLSLLAPCYGVGTVLLAIALRPTLLELVWLVLLPLCLILFAVVFGITVDLKFHSTDGENEVAIVKQSASAGFGGFAGPVAALLCGAAILLTPAAFGNLMKLGLCVVMLAATALLYRHNNKKDPAAL